MTKLLRVALLVPVVVAITLLMFGGQGAGRSQRPPFHLFLVGFVALVTVNSLELIPEPLRLALEEVSRWARRLPLSASRHRSRIWRPWGPRR